MTTTTNQTSERTIWTLDPSHSEIQFKVKHLMISNVKGEFRKVNATMEMEGTELKSGTVRVTIDAASVFTNDENRDKHLMSADFFDVEHHPQITFTGTSWVPKGSDHELKGDLTIKGVTNPITLHVEVGGVNKDPYGNDKMGFSIAGKINRKDWGLNWNAALETGGVLVSEEVRISAEVQFVKQ